VFRVMLVTPASPESLAFTSHANGPPAAGIGYLALI
jgi:hypothetical protein